MDPIEPYVNAIIGMIGIAYPFLLQVITNLDSKYSNDKITELFEKEPVSKAFKSSLYISLIFVGIWSLKRERLSIFKSKYEWFIFLMDNSGNILVAMNAIVLVVLFSLYIDKVFTYTAPSRLIPYLINKYNHIDEDENYFEILKELFLHYIRNQQAILTSKISNFFYFAFLKIRRNSIGTPVIYPTGYYNLIYRSIEELAILKDKRNITLEYKTAGSLWLIGETYGNEISDETYYWIWNNLLLAIRYNQDDLILHHWETCHQYFSLNLQRIHPNYEYNLDTFQVSNSDEVDKRKKDRNFFLEFHIALGALLLYRKRTSALKEIFEYTQSEPPTYELFPVSVFEILSFYVKFSDPYDREYYKLYIKYSFPNARGMNGEKVIKNWICKYLAILYLRSFTLGVLPTHKNLVDNKLAKGEIKVWITRLKELEGSLKEWFSEKTFLNSLNIEYLSVDFFEKRSLLNPIEFLTNYLSELENTYTFNLEKAVIDSSKVLKFKEETNLLISKKIASLRHVNVNKNPLRGDLDKWFVNGEKTVVERDFLAVESEAEYLNLYTILAENVIENLSITFSNTFNIKTTISYLIKPEELLLSIQKLNLDESYVIVIFGVDLGDFSDVDIISFEERSLGSQALYILKKSDLPTFDTLPIEQEIIEKYSLELINEELNLYTTHVSLDDETKIIYKENKGNRTDDEMRKSLLLGVFIKTEITWKNNIDVLQLRSYSIYLNSEFPNSIEEIKPLN